MAKRVKRVLLSGVTREQAEDAFADFAAADAKKEKLQATMDIAITKIRDKHAVELASLEETKNDAVEIIQSFAESNRDQFGKKKSMEMTHGVIGFRTGTPTLKTLKGYTWASALNLIKEFLPDYIRTKDEVAKDRLLIDREMPSTVALFPKVGIYVDQDETFFVEPKKETADV